MRWGREGGPAILKKSIISETIPVVQLYRTAQSQHVPIKKRRCFSFSSGRPLQTFVQYSQPAIDHLFIQTRPVQFVKDALYLVHLW